MRRAILLLLTACHAAERPAVVAVDLPKDAPQPAVVRDPGPPHFSMIIDFEVLRSHPASAQLAVLIPALPMWREFLPGSKIDVMRDCDWLSIEGPNVHDASDDVVFVHYRTSDADVDAAIDAAHAVQLDVNEPRVKAWMSHRSAILRPSNDHLLAVVPRDRSDEWAKRLASAPIHIGRSTNRAVDIHSSRPHDLIPMFPEAFFEERITIFSEGEGARLRMEGDCADKESAEKAVPELEQEVRKRNTLAVKIATHGAFSLFKAQSKGPLVYADVPFNADQVNAVLQMTALAEGANLPQH